MILYEMYNMYGMYKQNSETLAFSGFQAFSDEKITVKKWRNNRAYVKE